MKTEISLLGKRINMAQQARRRWLVALIYAGFSAVVIAWFSSDGRSLIALLLGGALLNLISSIIGRQLTGDERELYRRDHAHYVAYRALAWVLMLALFAAYFRGPNPVTPIVNPAFRFFLMQLPYGLLMAAGILYCTLPQAIMLWKEPNMEEFELEPGNQPA